MYILPAGIITVLVLLLIETRLASKWSSLYFKKGIQLYAKEMQIRSSALNIDDLEDSLNNSFKGTGFSPSILFQQLDDKTIAFREKLFEFSLFSYTPLMHGKIEINNAQFHVTGFSNWYPIAFMFLWYSSIFQGFRFSVDFMFLIAPVIIFGVIYLMQSRRYNKILSQLDEIN